MSEVRDLKSGRFVKGHVPLPKTGMKQLNEAFRRDASPEILQELFHLHWELCHHEDKRIAHDAIVTLENRLLGKPQERLEIEATANHLAHLSTEYILRELARLSAANEQQPQPQLLNVVDAEFTQPQESPQHAPGRDAEALASLSHPEAHETPQKGKASLGALDLQGEP